MKAGEVWQGCVGLLTNQLVELLLRDSLSETCNLEGSRYIKSGLAKAGLNDTVFDTSSREKDPNLELLTQIKQFCIQTRGTRLRN